MGTLNSDKFEKTIKEIEKELLDLHRLIVEIWRRDTIYNKKIISAIKKDDDSICQNKGYEIYMEDDNAL